MGRVRFVLLGVGMVLLVGAAPSGFVVTATGPVARVEVTGTLIDPAVGSPGRGSFLVPSVTRRPIRFWQLPGARGQNLEGISWAVSTGPPGDPVLLATSLLETTPDGLRGYEVETTTGRLRMGDLVLTERWPPDGPVTVVGADTVRELLLDHREREAPVDQQIRRVSVSVRAGALRGRSSELALALAAFDALSRGDLTGGELVAATGTLTSDGAVGAVDGIQAKAWSAAAGGATVLLVPAQQQNRARASGAPITVIGVSNLAEALTVLGYRS